MVACLLLMLIALMATKPASALESAAYETLLSDGKFELRLYSEQIRVETEVKGSFESAGNRAFRALFNYISGENQSQQKIAMTAPVSQGAPEKLAMTRPVSQSSEADGSWRVGFLVPSQYSVDTAPIPTNPAVKLRVVPAQQMAVVAYSGTWSDSNYMEQLKLLQEWMASKGLEASGEPTWARYDSPFKPWFLRRNEILVPFDEKPAIE